MSSKLEIGSNGKLNERLENEIREANCLQVPKASRKSRRKKPQMSPTDADGRSRTVKDDSPSGGVRIFDRRPSGKVAALPKEVREIVNTMLDDGHAYDEIVEKLAELGYSDFNVKNISRWKLNGYEQWLRRQEQLEEMKLRTESMLEIAQNFRQAQSAAASPSPLNGERIPTADDPFVEPMNRRSSLPLPQGEGRGEGEGAVRAPKSNQTGQDILDGFWSVGEGLLAMEVVEALMETSHAELSLEEKGKLLSRIGRVVAANRRERTHTAKQNLEERKYADERHDLFAPPPPRQKRDLHEPLTQEETEAIVHKVDELFGIKLMEPQPDTSPAGTPALPGANWADAGDLPLPEREGRGEGEETVQSSPARNVDTHSSEPPSAKLPITNCQLPITNSPPSAQSSIHPLIQPSINPNPVGEWPQPTGTIPIVNVLGCIVGWAAHPEIPHSPDLTLRDPAANKAEPIQCNQKTVAWYDRNAQVRNCPTRYPISGRPHFIPVINCEGQVIDWREWDDEWFENLPPQNPRPVLSDGFRGQIIAWIDK